MINILQRKTSQQKSFPKSFLHMLDCVCVPVLSTQELSYSYACIWGENRRLGKPRMCKWQSKVTIQRHKEPFLRLHSIKAKVTIIYTFCASLKKMLLKDDTENLLNPRAQAERAKGWDERPRWGQCRNVSSRWRGPEPALSPPGVYQSLMSSFSLLFSTCSSLVSSMYKNLMKTTHLWPVGGTHL